MIVNVKFVESNQTINADFGEVYRVSDGGYDQGYEDGKNSVVDLGKYTYLLMFRNLNLFGKNEITLNLDNVFSFSEMFRRNTNFIVENTTVEHITLNCPNKIVSMYYTFSGEQNINETTIKHITLNVDTENATTWQYCYRYCKGLEIIDGIPMDFSSTTNTTRMFDQCIALKEMRFVPNTLKISISLPNSNILSNETKQSIFDGLATVETAQTLTLHANLKILQSQVDSANEKGWNVAGGIVVSEEEYYAE